VRSRRPTRASHSGKRTEHGDRSDRKSNDEVAKAPSQRFLAPPRRQWFKVAWTGHNSSVPPASENNHSRATFFGEPPHVSPGAAGATQPRALRDYLRVLSRRKWYVILTAILVAVLAVTFAAREPKAYRAESQVLLNRQDLANAVTGTQNPQFAEDPARYAATQAAVARSHTVAASAISLAHVSGRTPSELLNESSVAPDATADVLDFSVQDSSAAAAARLVNAYTNAFVAYHLRIETGELFLARRQLKQELSKLSKNSPNYDRLLNSEQQLRTMQLLQSRDHVLSNPTAGVQVQPRPTRDGLLGLGFGILIGLGLAFAAEALDRRVRTAEEVEEEIGLPLLASIPAPPRGSRGGIAMFDDPGSPYAEALRRLATNIVFSNPDRVARTLMFTSALQQEGKSTTLANLGVALAAVGNRVVLVDLDLRRPCLASLFGVHRLIGLTDVTVGRKPLDEALFPVRIGELNRPESSDDPAEPPLHGSLYLLPTGPLPLSPGEFVASDALAERVLAPLREAFDYVLVDSPPACVVGDAIRLAARVDGVVAITRLGLASRAALSDLHRELTAAPTPPLGVVVTGVRSPALAAYARYAHYSQREAYAAAARNGKSDRSRSSRRAGV
jgi:capsular exopolysaccharide synthesis family protein